MLANDKNREYATSQVKDLAAKLSNASDGLGRGGQLKLRDAPILAAGEEDKSRSLKGKGKVGYHGVEEEDTALSKATQDG